MSTLVRPAFHSLTLSFIACSCLMAAQTVNTVVDVWLQPVPSFQEELARTAPVPKEELPTPLALASLARYLGLPDKLREDVIYKEPGEEGPMPTTLGLKLLGTMVAAHPSASIASVYEGLSRRTRSIWMGGDIQGAEVIAIERTRVLLLNSGRLEYIGPDSAVSSTAMEPRPTTPPTADPSSGGPSVRQVGPRDYELSRHELDVALANPNQLITQARVVPSFRDGVPQGFKMFSVRPGSLYERIGLQNGDVLQRVNGLSLKSVEQSLEAYQKLRESSRVELEVERNGQPIRLTYSIR